MAQALVLRFLSTIDSVLSVALIVLTVLMFKVSWIKGLARIEDITEFQPAEKSYWITEPSARFALEDYVFTVGGKGQIPVIVLYERPLRDLGLYSSGGTKTFKEYQDSLDVIASVLAEIDFPIIAVMEPDWMMETLNTITELSESDEDLGFATFKKDVTVVYEDGSSEVQEKLFKWHQQNWDAFIFLFKEFAAKVPVGSRVYIDAGHPRYQATMGYYGLELLRQSLGDRSKVRGVSINVANFYGDEDLLTLGVKANEQQMYWVADTSRNGGVWSNSSWSDLESCKFDPPFLATGQTPLWTVSPSYEADAGKDADLWIKVPGEADGRLFAAGEYNECLIGHEIPCSSECPEIPDGAISGLCADQCVRPASGSQTQNGGL
jgi:hypothetical protein